MATTAAMIPSAADLQARARTTAGRCGVALGTPAASTATTSPINGEQLHSLEWADAAAVDSAVERAQQAFLSWRMVPAPERGAVVKRLGELLTEHKRDLATLITLEVGKITSEALGEVQEMIDICDFAVALSRQLYGRTMPSERPGHRLMETWHPLGVVGVISAFNFPAAVWSWNTAVALVCGDPVIWKPSEQAPLTASASAALLGRALAEHGAPADVSQVLLGGAEVGRALVDHPGVALLSATGSTRMGRAVGPRVAERFGRSLLELGGNNAAVVAPSADLDLATRGIVFSAAGTAGQRCTTLRRVIAHASVIDELVERVSGAYARLPIGDPLATGTLVGPLAEPALVRLHEQTSIVRQETFAPILYAIPYDHLEEAIALNNAVPQGLSSSIFTQNQAEAERFMSADGSDCGIVNVNIGTSGAEIGGAFGGEKETGGGRESGSDAWQAYMRRATNTINFSGELPLAQGVDFTV
jgi:aldehyde dehydrogenase (NAD+)